MNIKKLYHIRKKIDKLDNKLLDVIKMRTNLVEEVIKIKRLKKQIIDKVRIKKVLRNIKILSRKKNIDTEITRKIWISIINSYIKYEKKNFKKK